MANSQWRQFDAERMILWEQRLGDLGRADTEFRETLASATGAISPIYWNEGYATDFPLLDRHYTKRLYETWFVPNNTILVFVGDTTLAAVQRLAEQYFARIPRAAETHDTLAVEPPHHELIRVEMDTPRYGPAIDVRHRIPAIGHPDRAAVELLGEVAGDPAGPVGQATVGAGVALSLSSNTVVTHTDRFSVPSSLNIVARASSNERLEDLEAALVAAVEKLAAAPIDDAALAAAKKRRRTHWERRKLNWDDLAFDLGHYEIMSSWQTLFRELDAVQAVTAADLQRVAAKYFVRTNRVIGVARRRSAVAQ
jgi:predicted Zn-dependent peptidase